MDISIFTERVRELRGDRSQREVAEGIGITQQTYGRYENGARRPDLEIIERMAVFFEVSADYLLGLSDQKTPDFEIQSAAVVTGLSQATIEHIQDLTRQPMPPEARPLLNMIIQHIPTSLISDTIRAHDAVIRNYELRKRYLKKYCADNNVVIPESLLTPTGYNHSDIRYMKLRREIEDFEFFFRYALAVYYERLWNSGDFDSDDYTVPFSSQSLQYANLQLDLASLLQSRLEQDVLMSVHRLCEVLGMHTDYLNEKSKAELETVCEGLLKLNGEKIWQAIINGEDPTE